VDNTRLIEGCSLLEDKDELCSQNVPRQSVAHNLSNLFLTINPVDKLRDLGITIDDELTMDAHVANVVRSCFTSFDNYAVFGDP